MLDSRDLNGSVDFQSTLVMCQIGQEVPEEESEYDSESEEDDRHHATSLVKRLARMTVVELLRALEFLTVSEIPGRCTMSNIQLNHKLHTTNIARQNTHVHIDSSTISCFMHRLCPTGRCYLFIYLLVYLSICLFIYLSIYLFIGCY